MEKERGLEEIFEHIVAENFANTAKETSIRSKRQRGPLPTSITTKLHHVTSYCNTLILDPRIQY